MLIAISTPVYHGVLYMWCWWRACVGGKEIKEGKKGEQATSNCALRLLLSKLCILLGWFLTNVLSKTVVVLREKDKAMRCDLTLATI